MTIEHNQESSKPSVDKEMSEQKTEEPVKPKSIFGTSGSSIFGKKEETTPAGSILGAPKPTSSGTLFGKKEDGPKETPKEDAQKSVKKDESEKKPSLLFGNKEAEKKSEEKPKSIFGNTPSGGTGTSLFGKPSEPAKSIFGASKP